MELEYLPELIEYAINPNNQIHSFLLDEYFEGMTAEDLKTRLLVNIVAERISYMYKREQSVQGPKTDRIRRFFDSITEQPQDYYMLCELFNVSEDTVKNIGRYDAFKYRGKVKTKTDRTTKTKMIFRLPVD